jgi:trehalose 6-phosphate synthase
MSMVKTAQTASNGAVAYKGTVVRKSRHFGAVIGYAFVGMAASIMIILAVSSLSSILVKRWARRDEAASARLVFSSIRDEIATEIADNQKQDILPLLDQIEQDQRILALGFCSQTRALEYATKDMPGEVDCHKLPLAHTVTFANVADKGERTRVSIFPMTAGKQFGHLLVLGDLSYVAERSREARFYTVMALLGVGAGFGLVTITVILALTRGWIRSIRVALEEARRGGQLQTLKLGAYPVGSEISALLTEFRAERKFANGIHIEWSPQTLQQLLTDELPGAEVLIVSNREPYIHNYVDETVTLQTPASGVVAALEPVMRACGGTWIAHGGGTADRDTVDGGDRIRVPPGEPAYTLRRVWLTDAEQDGYYYGFANEGMWPLCHVAFVRPMFRRQDWSIYKAVNERFADTVLEEATCEDPIVLVQDYHFALLPRMIRKRLPKATIITFWHIPWPNAETFSICPWREEITDGLLGSTILGFHTQFHCNNFLEATDRFMESRIDRENSSVILGGHETLIRPYPISIAWPSDPAAIGPPVEQCRDAVRRRFGLPEHVRIAVGVERFDYTKGILDRIRAVDDLLSRHAEWRGKFVLVQVAAPTRGKLDAYSSLQAEAAELAEAVNAKYRGLGFDPVQLVVRHHETNEVVELFRAADMCVVSSLHDGMNLVAKEFVAARDDEEGVLILSGFAGASCELSDALIVNPYDTHGMADALDAALRMPAAEQRNRMRVMRDLVRRRNVYRWAAQMLLDASWVRRRERIMLAA